MSLSSDLEKLQREKREEIRTLHQTYLRTKRTVVRTASPGRLVRRHMGLSLAAAAAVGMLFAPRPSPAPVQAEAEEAVTTGKSSIFSSLGKLKGLIARISPQAASFIPAPPAQSDPNDHATWDDEPPPAPKPAKKKASPVSGILGTLVKELAALALAKIDFKQLIAEAMKQFSHPKPDEDGHEPHMSAANAGTVQPHDYENFQ